MGCNVEIFASCHCSSCEGFGPLLCYNHFLKDCCKHIRTKSDLTHSPTSGNDRLAHLSPKRTELDAIECATCFHLTPIKTIGLSPKCWQSLKRTKGYFYYNCVNCLTKSANDSLDCSSISDDLTSRACFETRGNSDSIITRKRHKHMIYDLKPKLQPSSSSTDPIFRPVPLISLRLKPPPINLLRKWWRILNLDKCNTEHSHDSRAVRVNSKAIDCECKDGAPLALSEGIVAAQTARSYRASTIFLPASSSIQHIPCPAPLESFSLHCRRKVIGLRNTSQQKQNTQHKASDPYHKQPPIQSQLAAYSRVTIRNPLSSKT